MYIQTGQENHQTHTALGVLKVPENSCIFCERKRRSSKPNTRPISLCSYSHREKPSPVCSSWKPALSISAFTTDSFLQLGLENNPVFSLASFLALFLLFSEGKSNKHNPRSLRDVSCCYKAHDGPGIIWEGHQDCNRVNETFLLVEWTGKAVGF